MRRAFKTLLMMAILAVVTTNVASAVPNLMNYQGRLTDGSGAPLNGAQSVVFAIYSVASGGSALWSETQSVTVTNGLFNVILGSTTPFPSSLFSGGNLYLGIKVGSDAEMTPRQRIGSMPYAQRAGIAEAPGFAYSAKSSGMSVNSTTTAGVVDSLDITVPAAGFVKVEASGETYANHITGSLTFASFAVDPGRFNIGSPNLGGSTQVFYYGSLPSQNYDQNIYIAKYFAVPAAGTYRYYFNERFNTGGSGASFFVQYVRLAATYYAAAMGSTSSPQSSMEPARDQGPRTETQIQP